MIKTAAELLQVAALRTRTVSVRDAEVRVRELTVRGRQEFAEIVKSGAVSTSTWLLKTCVIDEQGQPLFSEEEAMALAEASPEVVDAISGAILEVSGLRKKEEEKKD